MVDIMNIHLSRIIIKYLKTNLKVYLFTQSYALNFNMQNIFDTICKALVTKVFKNKTYAQPLQQLSTGTL